MRSALASSQFKMTVLPVVTGFLYRLRTQTIIRQKVYCLESYHFRILWNTNAHLNQYSVKQSHGHFTQDLRIVMGKDLERISPCPAYHCLGLPATLSPPTTTQVHDNNKHWLTTGNM